MLRLLTITVMSMQTTISPISTAKVTFTNSGTKKERIAASIADKHAAANGLHLKMRMFLSPSLKN